jgi:ribonucleoside-triphosphate reductase (formate)
MPVYCFEVRNNDEPYFTLPSGIITHNCRLRSETDNEYFNSFGSGSSKIGSLGVCNINLPRLASKCIGNEDKFHKELADLVEVCAKVNHTKRHVIKSRIENGNLPLYSLGYMSLGKQYSTVGVNGLNEACELMGYNILQESGQSFVLHTLGTINSSNEFWEKRYKTPHNCEQIPGENSSIKLADKDRLLGYTDYPIYSNQFIPLVTEADMLDRIRLQGMFDKHFSGGAICHLNVEEKITDPKHLVDLIKFSAKMGVVYFAVNYLIQKCENDHMTVGNNKVCPVCGAGIKDQLTRVVGFLTSVKNWHKVRREQDFPHRQFYQGI